MIDIKEPLELDDGTPVTYNTHDGRDVRVEYPSGELHWHKLTDGSYLFGGPKQGQGICNVGKPTEAPKKSDDQEFWERAYLSALSNSAPGVNAETRADEALKARNERWPS